MHPIPVVVWPDWIRYISDTEQAANRSSDRANHADHSHRLLSIVFGLKLALISLAGRKRCHSVSILLLTIALCGVLQPNAVAASPSPPITSSAQPMIVERSESNKSIDSLSLPPQPKSNSIRNSSSSHLKDQFLRIARSVKLSSGHRLKHRRSSTGGANKGYQSNGKGGPHSPKTNNWSVLGDQDAEYALKMLEAEHLTSAILHFIEITYKYAESNLPTTTLQQQNDPNGTLDGRRFTNKYYNSGSCVQARLDSLRTLLKPASFAKYERQAATAKRTASLLTTLLSERLELTSDRNYYAKNHFGHNDSSNIVLHKAFFWSLLKVNLQSDPNLFANGIIFRPDLNQFPIKLFSTIQSNKEDNQETSNNSSTNKPFAPYIFRKKANSFKAKLSTNSSASDSGTNRTAYNYVNLSGIGQWSQRIVPNPNLKLSVADLQGLMEEKAANLNQLKHSLYNKKQPEPNTYCYSFDWYTTYADKYLNSSQPFNYHELAKSHYLNNSADQGYWGVPYSDCMVTGSWLLSYSVPFFGLSKSTNQIEFKGVVLISIDLSDQDINQCSPDDPFFPNSHKCDRETTECIPIKGLGFRRGAYVCECKSSYYIPNVAYSPAASLQGTIKNQSASTSSDGSRPARHYFNGTAVESAFIDTHAGMPKALAPLFPTAFQCVACPKDCSECESNQSCKVSYTSLTRVLVLGVQSFCATISFILAITTFRLRRSKSFASSRWIILEALLFGSLLLYITVIVQYFEPKPLNCFLVPWFREVGFGFVYGSIIIKLYRIYAEFQTRKAHRVCVRDKDLLKYLCAIILVIVGYMAAWSALILETIDGFANLVNESAEVYIIQIGRTVDNLKFVICKQLSWDYVTELGELSFILAGFYMSYSIRNARSEFYREKWALCTCIYLEFVVSGTFYVLRYFLWNSLHPDLLYLLYFVRCQLTVTVVLALIFGPKIFFQNRPPTSSNTRKSRFFTGNEPAKQDARLPEQAMKLHAAILSNGEIDVSDINLAEMDPEDIRTELRRVYTQLQVLKNKTIRKDNPHISKRRGGRKTHRRFSLQFNAHNKHVHKSHHYHPDHEQEITEVSRTPEESTASLEQSTVFADGQSSVLSSK